MITISNNLMRANFQVVNLTSNCKVHLRAREKYIRVIKDREDFSQSLDTLSFLLTLG